MPTPATAVTRARQLRDPDSAAIAASPENPGDLQTVEQVDWTALIIATLGPKTTLDKPLPQLLLRLGEVISQLTGNAEHLKHFTGATSQDQEDLAGSVHRGMKATKKTVGEQALVIEDLKRRVEQLEAERSPALPRDTSTVQRPDLSHA